MSKLLVGIDAGGTSQRIRLTNEIGDLVKDVQGSTPSDLGPSNLKNLLAQTDCDLAHVKAVCAGVAGISRKGMNERWTNELHSLFPNASLTLGPDYLIAFHAALAGAGILVIAGTGSIVYGENADATCRVGGRGWEWGDWGSGAWLTAEMMKATLKALDGLQKHSPLVDATLSELASNNPIEVGNLARQKCDVDGRGFLVPVARKLFDQGDAQAIELFTEAAEWLAKQTLVAANQLGFTKNDALSVATVGGLWECGTALAEPFAKSIHLHYPQALLSKPDNTPVDGAIRLALKSLK